MGLTTSPFERFLRWYPESWRARYGDELTALLEDIARHSRNVDKAVYRHCADILGGRRDAVRRAQRCEELAAALQALLEAAPMSITHLLEIEREARSIEGGEPLPDQLGALLTLANARVRAESEQQRRLQELLHDAAALCGELKAPLRTARTGIGNSKNRDQACAPNSERPALA